MTRAARTVTCRTSLTDHDEMTASRSSMARSELCGPGASGALPPGASTPHCWPAGDVRLTLNGHTVTTGVSFHETRVHRPMLFASRHPGLNTRMLSLVRAISGSAGLAGRCASSSARQGLIIGSRIDRRQARRIRR